MAVFLAGKVNLGRSFPCSTHSSGGPCLFCLCALRTGLPPSLAAAFAESLGVRFWEQRLSGTRRWDRASLLLVGVYGSTQCHIQGIGVEYVWRPQFVKTSSKC